MSLYPLFHLLSLHVTSCVYNINRSSHRRCSLKKSVPKNFANFTGKHLCRSLFNKVAVLRDTYFEEHLWATASICNEILLEKITNQEQKFTKQCFLPPPHWFSTQCSQYQYWKASKYSILMVIELGLPVSEFSTGSTFYAPTDSEHKFHKAGIENWLLIGFSLALLSTAL